MATSYTPNKRIGEPAVGDTGWGPVVNSSLTQIDTAFGGVTSLSTTGLLGDQLLTSAQYVPLMINVTGDLSLGDVTYVVPANVGGQWTVYNGTATGSGALKFRSAVSATSVTIPRGAIFIISCDGVSAYGMRTVSVVSSVAFSTSLSGLTVSGSPITSSGTINLSGTLGTANGGTGLTTPFSFGGAIYASDTTTLTSGTLPTSGGGTGLSIFTADGAIYATSTSVLTSGTLPVASGGTGVTTSTGTGNVVLSNGPTITLGNATGLPLATGVTGTLPVGNGGTGLATTPANGEIDIGNGTGFTRATLTAGTGVTITNAAGAITVAASGFAAQSFTSSGTFTIPSGVTAVKVTIVGAGGGGQSSGCIGIGSGGGAGGAAIKYLSSLTPGNTISVTVGTGGASAPYPSTGGTGGSSSIASGTQTITTVTASGGTGGTTSGGGTGGSVTAGSPTLSINGGSGNGIVGASSGTNAGGSSIFGGGGYGAGGDTASSGKSGLVLFEW